MIAEESVPLRARFSVHDAIEWFKAPENAERIEAFAQRADDRLKELAFKADEMIGRMATVAKDILENPEVERDFWDSLLDSAFRNRDR